LPPSVRMSQPLRVAGFELIISGRFWVIAKVEKIIQTISDHASEPLADLTGKQDASFARAGIDMASASPLLMRRHTAAQSGVEPPQPVNSAKKSRASAQVDCRPAAAFILQYINSKVMSLTDLAIKAQTTDRTLRRLRNEGKIRRDILKRLADAMGVSIDKLVG